MKRHIREVHDGKKPQRNRKRTKGVKCDICEGTFECHSHLNRHIASVHEGMKLFKCELCDFTSTTKGYLNKHIAKIHEKKKPFIH